MERDLEIRRIAADLEPELARYFCMLADAGEDQFFRPHAFTPEEAFRISHYSGADHFSLALYEGEPVAYGMLRGWDEGYEIPSLGISVHPGYRGKGLGITLMHYLHSVASLRGSTKVRLRVHVENQRAKRLYEKLGYRFEPDRDHYLVGFLDLK